MGKQKRAREKRKADREEKEKAELKRRRFLKIAGGTGLLAVIGGGIYHLTKPEDINITWDFLDYNFEHTKIPAYEQIQKIFVPLCALGDVSIDVKLDLIEEWGQELDEEMTRRNFNKSLNYKRMFVEQIFGKPLPEEPAMHLKEYCIIADEFLNRRIKGLNNESIDWTVVRPGQNFTKNSHKKGYILYGYCELIEARIIHPLEPKKSFAKRRVKTTKGGSLYIMVDEITYKPKDWFICISSGEPSLTSPFSEILPLSTTSLIHQYAEKVGYKQALLVEEGFGEAAALRLVYELLEELESKGIKIPENAEKNIMISKAKLSKFKKYRYVPNALRWMKNNGKEGVQKAYDMYRESPQKFFEAIKKA